MTNARQKCRALCYKTPGDSAGRFCYKGHDRAHAHHRHSPAGAAPARPRCSPSVIPRLIARGLRVSTIKHAHHGFDVDQPGKDSHHAPHRGRDRGAGHRSAKRFALLHELRGEPEWDAAPTLLAKLSPVDLVLVEGFKREAHPEARSLPRGERQAAAASGRSAHRRDRVRHAAAAGEGAGGRPRRHRGDRRCAAQARRAAAIRRGRACGARDGAAHRRLLRVLRPAAADRRHGAADRRARARRSPRPRRVAAGRGARARARRRCRRADRPAAVRQFRGRRLRGAPRAISAPRPRRGSRSSTG